MTKVFVEQTRQTTQKNKFIFFVKLIYMPVFTSIFFLQAQSNTLVFLNLTLAEIVMDNWLSTQSCSSYWFFFSLSFCHRIQWGEFIIQTVFKSQSIFFYLRYVLLLYDLFVSLGPISCGFGGTVVWRCFPKGWPSQCSEWARELINYEGFLKNSPSYTRFNIVYQVCLILPNINGKITWKNITENKFFHILSFWRKKAQVWF